MNIELHLFATLAQYLPGGTSSGLSFQAPEGATPRDILEMLSVPPAHVKLIFINGAKGGWDSKLKDKDRLGIFPAVGGG